MDLRLRCLLLGVVLALPACAAQPAADSPREDAPVSDYRRLEGTQGLTELEGQRVVLVGHVSDTPWQHMIGDFPSHPHATYFDVGDDQLVVYTKERLEAGGELELRGTVVQIEGRSKRPGSTDRYSEWQLLVDAWTPAGE